ncbi:glycosyltransferase family 4 protein [Bisgaard Taxon 10/6]|uniref:glycosyltransferase family 4 protein n=1 Tax=Exercitatus varius TaxID=67857 RepID=UPI00294B8544|nr:glycosyltransferase family 4 protein [Exercitatus varius]MDG2956251.1 glycosyltransferase family 4 protein [Exercitatus varius]MDG2964369.1 glycosyltransferase family 4 protein [Exercitatus varius]
MKKIVLLKWTFDNVDGGEKVAINLANELANYNDVYLVSLNSSKLPFYPVSDKVHYVNLGSGRKRIRDGFLSNIMKLRKFIISNKIDIIFSIGVSTNLFMLLSSLFLGIKTVFCEHTNTKFKQPGLIHLFQRYLGAKYSTKIITLTKEDRENYITEYGVPEDKIGFIYNWIDTSVVNEIYDPSIKKILTVGRFTFQKGYDILAIVASKIYDKYPDWVWDIYGDGNLEIKEKLQDIPNICLKGIVKGTENIFPGHSIYVMTSYFEGLPLVLLEAKQFKLPIVSFNCPTGPSDIIRNGVNGFIIDEFDVEKMVTKISQLIENKTLREEFSSKSNLDVEKFSKDMILDQWLNLIESL